jgi:hypothetical protein
MIDSIGNPRTFDPVVVDVADMVNVVGMVDSDAWLEDVEDRATKLVLVVDIGPGISLSKTAAEHGGQPILTLLVVCQGGVVREMYIIQSSTSFEYEPTLILFRDS